ncbi:hypothetical protein A0257_13960 [Hymenobacter psoromatis]|nr:hypothetical protein A0257_13960 [Hymenobacter psoromatis]
MTTSRFSLLFLFAVLASTLAGCSVAGDIFKGGLWVGVIGVFLVVLVIWWLVSKMGGGSGGGGTSA